MEQLANNAASTLGSGINNSVTTLTVASATQFPSTGNFRILIDNEIMLVTGVSGTTFTVTRGVEGTTAASHSTSAAVTHILTKEAINQLFADSVLKTTYSGIPSAGKTGRLVLLDDALALLRDNGSTFDAYGLLNKHTIPPLSSAFTWNNQGSSTITDNGGTIYLQGTNAVSNQLTGMHKAAPSAPYTLTVRLIPDIPSQNYSSYGLYWRSSSSGKCAVFNLSDISSGSLNFLSRKYNDFTNYNSDYSGGVPQANLQWLRLQDDGTNRIMSISADGINWKVLHTVANNDFVIADQIGFFLGLELGSGLTVVTSGLTVASWLEA